MNKKNINALTWQNCIAKTTVDSEAGCTIREHSIRTAEVARALINMLPKSIQNELSGNVVRLAAIHDVGKISPGFQKRILSGIDDPKYQAMAQKIGTGYETDHARTGAAALEAYFGNRFGPSDMAQIIAIHHGSIRKPIPPDDSGSIFGGKSWAKERAEFLNEIFKKYGVLENRKLDSAQRNLLSGLITAADWIASDEQFFQDTSNSIEHQAQEAIKACGFFKPVFTPNLSFKEIFDNRPYTLQQQFINSVEKPGLYVLEAPMGTGKTEAALYAAYKLIANGYHHGLFFGLPTRLTSNKIHERVEPFLKTVCGSHDEVKLAHGTAWLEAFKNGGEDFSSGSSWFNPRKRSLLYPFTVGTIDQALLSILRVKHFFLRSFGLAGKVIILDEVHSYDMYTGSLMETMIHDLIDLKCTVIILSATLTGERRERLFSAQRETSTESAYPLITGEVEGKRIVLQGEWNTNCQYKINLQDWEPETVAKTAVQRAAQGECVLCIANTVAKAQAWFEAVKAGCCGNDFKVGLLHSKFPGFKRAELEKEWIDILSKNGERPDGCILISTQVVEQSVDIDADFLITELAPTDMLLQRMGRQWRHDISDRKCSRPETVIITGNPLEKETKEAVITALGKSNCLVYDPYVLWKTYMVWRELNVVNLPNNIRLLLETTYRQDAGSEKDCINELVKHHEKICEKLKKIAEASKAKYTSLPDKDDREGVATRYSDLPSMQVLLVKNIESSGNQAKLHLMNDVIVKVDRYIKNLKVTAALHENLITIATYLLRGFDTKTPDYLQKHFYEKTAVLLWDECNGCLSLNGRSTGLIYKPELGLYSDKKYSPHKDKHYLSDEELDDFDVFDTTRFDW
ncbi:CRISPR-associated helicase Cas3' [bacterium]|nr:CRISPR-associated helicase Cas3' [bacterium]